MHKAIHNLLLVGSAVIGVLVVSLLCSSEFVFATSLNLNVSTDNLVVDLGNISINGTYAKSDDASISVATDNLTGYTLSIAANESTDLVSNDGSIPSISPSTFADGISVVNYSNNNFALANNLNNTWAYLPGKLNSLPNDKFRPAPSTDGDLIDRTSEANSVANTYNLTIGARVDYSAKIGEYSNTFRVYTVANSITYSLIYKDNVISDMPTDQIESTSASSTINISSSSPTRNGYSFLGWCSVIPTNTNDTDVCTGGTQYSAGGTIVLTGLNYTNVLYAMWSKSGGAGNYVEVTTNLGTGVRMVTFTNTSGDSFSVTNDGTKLGLRTGTAYTITPSFVPGYSFVSWSTTNGGVLGSSSSETTTYTLSDTASLSITTNSYVQMQAFTKQQCETLASNEDYIVTDVRDQNQYRVRFINGNCWMVQNLRFQESSLTSDTSNVDSTYTSSNPKNITWRSLKDYSGCKTSSATSSNTTNPCTFDSGDDELGAWYNYSGATVQTITGTANSNDAVYDICPSGWRLPTRAEGNTITSYSSAFGAFYGGYYSNGSRYNSTAYSYWWTSTHYSTEANRYALYWYQDRLTVTYSATGRQNGFFVRCIRSS